MRLKTCETNLQMVESQFLVELKCVEKNPNQKHRRERELYQKSTIVGLDFGGMSKTARGF